MKAAIHINHAEHQRTHGEAIKSGLNRHDIETVYCGYDQPTDADFAVIWGWRQKQVIDYWKRKGTPILVMERAYLPDRMEWTSMGWDGLNGRARFPGCRDSGERFEKHWPGHLKPWKLDGSYALVCGQVRGDASLSGVNFDEWTEKTTGELLQLGYQVLLRPHPRQNGGMGIPRGARGSLGASLESDLSGASLCLTYNSNAGVEAVCAGVPTITMDEGSMAWQVTGHSIAAGKLMPDRTQWAHRLAWCQWRMDEISDGTAWEHLRLV
jgi:hypothetical protein